MLKQVKFLTISVLIALLFVFLKLLYIVPSFRRLIYEKFTKLAALEQHQVEGCILTWEMYKMVVHDMKQNIFKMAQLGKPAPDIDLCQIRCKHADPLTCSEEEDNGFRKSHGWDSPDTLPLKCLMRPGIPLVLSFGSCS